MMMEQINPSELSRTELGQEACARAAPVSQLSLVGHSRAEPRLDGWNGWQNAF